ncbi:related to YPT7 - GTP-binding protein of the RAB family [Ustilago trichophora]|uniref:Related to YPT7 - GTP-binding protein of the RAB family n=1 Tax=Ustilago trichophora TaxID=86804 RepID=A0A5C3EEG3_9BASI|nr:related to YPT7 - GTP-binding protein of the RAB family [Ustilago trichophora]
MPTKIDTRQDGPSTTTPCRKPAPAPPTLQRLRSGGDVASTLQSSAVAAMGSIRTLASISSSGTSLHPIAPKRAIKVVLIGDGGCGKTSIRNRFLTNTFFPSYRATIGADFITKTLPIDPLNPEGEKAILQIWDTAGQERFQSLGSAFYRGADAVIIAFDASKHNNVEEQLERVKGWYQAFMAKAPGPEGEAERRRFCWICAANKSDLLQQRGDGEREKVREALNSLVKKEKGEVDWGLDTGDEGVRPSGDDEPANPAEVLSRPDPNAGETEQGESTPSRSASGKANGSTTPSSRSNFLNGNIVSPSKKKSSTSNYRLSRKSLSSIAAAAAKQAESCSDADEPQPKGAKGGTMNTLYTTPFNTMSNLPLSASPPSTEITPKADESKSALTAITTGTGGGFLSSWMNRSKSKASSSSRPNRRGHTKRQSIKSIEVFQISDQELSDASDADPNGTKNRFAFPSSSSSTSKMQQETPPRSVRTAATGGGAGGGVSMKDRQRVDSTMSLNAPSVYHTPRSSTFFSVSPTPRTTLGIPSSSNGARDDGSIKHGHGRNQSTSSSLKIDSFGGEQHSSAKLKHKASIASSSQLSVATLKPNRPNTNLRSNSNNPMLRAPKSINDLFHQSPPLESPPAPQTPSTISLPIDPIPPPLAITAENETELESGFTLFYTSAKTGHNIDRMFAHILHRVVTSQSYLASLQAPPETDQQRQDRESTQNEIITRTIRLASGKNPDINAWFGGCC